MQWEKEKRNRKEVGRLNSPCFKHLERPGPAAALEKWTLKKAGRPPPLYMDAGFDPASSFSAL